MIPEGWKVAPTDAVLNKISQEFAFDEIREATEHFSSSHRLGEGTYGAVFRGTLKDGTEVAIKLLANPKEGGFREEVEVLSKFRHPNLVILMGFARNGRERYLVYELLPGGDVHGRLSKDASFTWDQRLNVVLDCSLGLSHLHGSRPQVFHRDVKTQNMLLDKNGTGKVADFGLACLAQPNQNSLAVSETSGTLGYADPLYIRSGVVTEKSEVYSMGMVLLEVLTGRPPALQHPSGKIEYQFSHINGEISKLMAMVDRRGRWPPLMAEHVGRLALQCTCSDVQIRPTFVKIVTELRKFIRDESLHQPNDRSSLVQGPQQGRQSNPFGNTPQQQMPFPQQQQQQHQQPQQQRSSQSQQQQQQQQQQLRDIQRREQQQREQQQREQQHREQLHREQQQREQLKREQQQREQQQREQQQREQLQREQLQREQQLREQQQRELHREQLKREQQQREQREQQQREQQQQQQLREREQHLREQQQREQLWREQQHQLQQQQQQRQQEDALEHALQRGASASAAPGPFPQPAVQRDRSAPGASVQARQRGVPAERAANAVPFPGPSVEHYAQLQQPQQLQQPAPARAAEERSGYGLQGPWQPAGAESGAQGRPSMGNSVRSSQAPAWPQPRDQMREGVSDGTATVASSGSGRSSSKEAAVDPDLEDKLSMMMGMGFARHKAIEAFKRCSTVEAAVDWLSENS